MQKLRRNVYDVLITNPELRVKSEIKLFSEYCQRFDLLKGKDENFYVMLHYGTTINQSFKKGMLIHHDPSKVRILYQGKIQYEDECF